MLLSAILRQRAKLDRLQVASLFLAGWLLHKELVYSPAVELNKEQTEAEIFKVEFYIVRGLISLARLTIADRVTA